MSTAGGYNHICRKMSGRGRDIRTGEMRSKAMSAREVVRKVILPAFAAFAAIALICTGEAQSVSAADSSKAMDARVTRIMKRMTLGQKVGQVLLVNAPEGAAKYMRKRQYGGYLFFGKDFRYSSPARFRKRARAIQKAAKINAFLAVDEEGGTVVRVSAYRKFRKSRYRSPREIYRSGGYKAVRANTANKCGLLRSIGLNANFAPVADMAYRPGDFMYQRSFSTRIDRTSKFIKTVVRKMNGKKVVSAVKHFPGYGGNGDTHARVIRDRRSRAALERRDLVPFRTGIKNNCSMIMMSHNIVTCFDGKRPASISPAVHRYLRKKMGYDGVIITDNMEMKGVERYGKSKGALAVKAFKAGNDIICTPYGYKSYAAILKAVRNGKISKARLDRSVRRIIRLKLEKGIIK